MMRTSTPLLIAACASALALTGAAQAQPLFAAAPAAAPPAAAAPRPAAAAPTAPAAAAAAPRPAVPQGPPIPGMCIYSNDVTLGTSAVGKFVAQRLQQLAQPVEAELTAEQTALQKDVDAYNKEAQAGTLAPVAQQQREQSLNTRLQAFQRKRELRSAEIQQTQQKALGRIVTEANPLLQQVYAQHNCSILLDGQVVMGANSAMNITPDVVKLLDSKITQFQFDREHLDQQQAAAAQPARAATTAPAQPRTPR